MAITTAFVCTPVSTKHAISPHSALFMFLSGKTNPSIPMVLPRCRNSSTSLQHCPGISYRDVDVIYAERAISGSSVLDHYSLHAKNGFSVLYFADL
jgi:hypothetical protein